MAPEAPHRRAPGARGRGREGLCRLPHRWLRSVLLCLSAALAAAAPAQEPLRFGWTAWSDAEFMTKLAARLVEDHLGREVELVLVDIALQYQGVARGDLDAMLMAWLPDTHADYYARFGPDLVDLGPIYTGGRLGWVVPAYVPEHEIGSIADLANPEIAGRLNREIIGIDPGAGLTRLSEAALEAYGLTRYNLITSSATAMTAMLERAHRREKWIVATAWRPHWMFQSWSLRFLDDPKNALGGRERCHVLVRKGLDGYAPEVVDLLARMYLPLAELEAALETATARGYEQAVSDYIDAHPKRIAYWLSERID